MNFLRNTHEITTNAQKHETIVMKSSTNMQKSIHKAQKQVKEFIETNRNYYFLISIHFFRKF